MSELGEPVARDSSGWATGVTALLTALSVTRTSPIRLSAARE
jgi:hypothetical protein